MPSLKKIGLTGSSGILGRCLIDNLKKENYSVHPYKNDILNKKKLGQWINDNQLDAILHLAAIVPTGTVKNNYLYSKKVNFNGTKNLVDGIRKNQKKKTYLFFSSSSHVYFYSNKKILEKDECKGISKYGKTKILAEKYLIKNSKDYDLCIGRISSLTSENQDKNYFLVNKIFKKKKLIFGNSNIKRNFIHVEDVSNLIILLMKKRIIGTYNISSLEITSFYHLFDYLKKKYKMNIDYSKKTNETLVLSNSLLLKKIGKYRFIKLKEIIVRILKKKIKK